MTNRTVTKTRSNELWSLMLKKYPSLSDERVLVFSALKFFILFSRIQPCGCITDHRFGRYAVHLDSAEIHLVFKTFRFVTWDCQLNRTSKDCTLKRKFKKLIKFFIRKNQTIEDIHAWKCSKIVWLKITLTRCVVMKTWHNYHLAFKDYVCHWFFIPLIPSIETP